MKKILLASFVAINLFGLTLEDRVKQLEKRVGELEKQLHITQKTQSKIVEQGVMYPKCDKLKIENYSYKLKNFGFYKGYDLTFNFKNNYKKGIKKFDVIVKFIDSDDTLLLQDELIRKNLNLKPNQMEVIKDSYLIEDDLSPYLATTSKNQIKFEVKSLSIEFEDGTEIKCYK